VVTGTTEKTWRDSAREEERTLEKDEVRGVMRNWGASTKQRRSKGRAFMQGKRKSREREEKKPRCDKRRLQQRERERARRE
jgi:hypothetical protein